VRRIEVAAYGRDAWAEALFERELRNAFAHYTVAEGHGDHGAPRVVGYAGIWFMVDQLHLASIAVDPERQSEGIGQRLLFDCVDRALDAEMEAIALEVRPSNERAVRLYEHFGFHKAGTMRGYYDDGEDALLLITPPLDDPDWQARIAEVLTAFERRWGALDQGPAARAVEEPAVEEESA
jgi:ribosomal-protein-alanine N-acetyltransferase